MVLTGDHGEQIERNKSDRILKLSVIKFYDYLNKLGLFENQRLSIYRKFYVGHGYHIIDSLVRVPLLFVHKDKLPQSLELDFQVSHVDVVPTLLSLLGMGISDLQMDGRSVLSCIEKRNGDSEHAAYMQACGIVLPDQSKWLEGIRYKGFKYVRHQKNKDSDELLFDLKSDPDERNNIKDTYLIEKMQLKLKEIKEKTLQYEDLKMSDEDMKIIADKLKDHGYM
jgi:arylsulfatase A-like enzyme